MDIEGNFGGGGGGGGHTPTEASDTLQSKQRVRLLLALSEGEIESIEDVLLNNVSITNFNATYEFRPGTALQTVIPGFIDTEAPIASFASVNLIPGTEYFTSVSYLAASCRITLTLNSLKQVTANNDIVGYGVSFDVYTRPSTSDIWTFRANISKSGKASSPYSWDTKIVAPTGVTSASNWEIKLIRLTGADDSKHFSASTWSAATEIIESNLTYPNTALLGVFLNDADQFGGSIPEITVKAKGMKVKIPTNYDPVAHTYDEGTPWDLSLTEGVFYYTANPAWHIYNILNRSKDFGGLGLAKADIDVISLYEISKYADELVSDGKGGFERRYELHNQFYTRENPSTFLMYLLTICNANYTTNEFGQLSFMFDRPGQAVTKIVTNANVLEGDFNGSSSEIEARYNLVNVTYNREEFNGKTDTATTVDDDLISRYGLQTSDIVLAGCKSESQALRKARWAIATSSYAPNIVSFRVLFAGVTYYLGEIIRVFDNENQGAMCGGVVKSFSSNATHTTIVLDREITLENEPYTLYFLDADGITERSYTILETNGTYDTVSFLGIATVAAYSPFTLVGPITSRLFKVVKITKSDDAYEILAAEHNESKYAYIEDGISVIVPSGDFVDVASFLTPAVTDVVVVENFSSNGVTQNSALDITWNWAKGTSKYAASFIVSWRRDNQEFNFVPDIFSPSYSIINPVPGLYEVTVWAVNPVSGIRSTPVVATYNFRTTATTSSLLPPENVYVAGTSGLIFSERDLHLTFTYPAANANVSDSLKDYVIEVWDTATTSLKGTYTVEPNTNLGGNFSFPFTENADRFGTATREFSIKVFSRDVIGDLSVPVQVTVNNPVPAVVSFTVTSGSESAYVDIISTPESDVDGYLIHREVAPETVTFTPGPGNLASQGPSTYITLAVSSGTEYFYKVAAYDSFGTDGVNYSGGVASTSLTSNVDTWVFSGLTFKPNDPTANKVSWTAGSASKNGGTATNITAGDSGTAWTSGIMYFYYVDGATTISVTNDIAVAVGGVQVLATYKGGTLLTVGNGNAYIDGGLLLANTVGANQLVTDTAIITGTAQVAAEIVDISHINSATITALSVADHIESTNYSATRKEGFRLDTTGLFETYGKIKIGTQNVGVGTATDTFVPGALTLNGNALLNNSIIKKQGVTTSYDEQGYSAESYTGSCAVYFSFAQTDKGLVAGLSTTPITNAGKDSINYAIHGRADGYIDILNSGTVLLTVEAAIQESTLVFTPSAFTLTGSGNLTITANSITKSSGISAWDSHGYSTTGFSSDITLKWTLGETNLYKMMGLNSDPTTDASYTSLDYAMEFRDNATVYIWENGSNKGSVGTYTIIDVFRISRAGTTITYYKNDIPLYTSSIASSATLSIDSSLHNVGASILNVQIGTFTNPTEYELYTPEDIFGITYSGTSIKYYRNEVLLHTLAVSAGQTLYFDSSIYGENGQIDQIRLGDFQNIVSDEGARTIIDGDSVSVYDRNNVARAELGRSEVGFGLTLRNANNEIIMSPKDKFDGTYIKNLSVDSLQIKDNAVTVPMSVYVSSVSYSTSLVTVASITIDIQDFPVLIDFSCYLPGDAFYNSGGTRVVIVASQLVLLRDSTTLWTANNVNAQFSQGFKDITTNGTHTYTIQARVFSNSTLWGGGSVTLTNATLTVLGVKK